MAALLAGIALGLASGVAPGPLLALTISATLRGGFRAGFRVALAPLISDVPVVLLSVTVLSHLPARALAAVSVVGGAVVIWFGIESIVASRRVALPHEGNSLTPAQATRRGVLTNITSPNPWLFWMTAGGTALLAAYRTSVWSAVAFLVGFYLCLIGAKVAVAAGVAAGRHRLSDGAYRRVLAVTGVVLCALGVLLAVDGVRAW